MKRSPRNKMIGSSEYRSKKREAEKPKRLKRYYFPHLGRSVEAVSREEAEKIINNQ